MPREPITKQARELEQARQLGWQAMQRVIERTEGPSDDKNLVAFPAPVNGHALTKNPAAVYLGRLGGRKGGKARAAKLSAERRSEIARMGGKSGGRGRQS